MRIKLFFCLFLINLCFANAQTTVAADYNGKWMSSEKNLELLIYRENGEFKAKIIWFKADDNSKSMEEWTDTHNPDKNLRNRKLLGLIVAKGLVYDPKTKTFEHGSIYDAKSGRYWDASAQLSNDGTLKVTGYWHFKFIGRTMTFKRVDE